MKSFCVCSVVCVCVWRVFVVYVYVCECVMYVCVRSV